MTYKDALIDRLKVEEIMTAGDLRAPSEGTKKLLIYSAHMHKRSALDQRTAKSSPRDGANWITSMLTQLDKFPDTDARIQYAQAHMDMDMDMVGQNGSAGNTGTHTKGAAEY